MLSLTTLIFTSLALGNALTPPLRTQGNEVLDAAGKPVRFACVNWYGAHMTRYVVNGLDKRPVNDIAASIASLGFNCVRLVFSNDLYFKSPPVNASAVSANPTLAGKPAMDAFDAVVEALTSNGVMVILNNHISRAGWCCSNDDGNGLWYTSEYPTSSWQSMWVRLAKRYKSNPLVVGADLRNELRQANGIKPTWGDGNSSTDWKMAAQDCGNAVLKENSNLLILVEGLSYANILGLQHGETPNPLCKECVVQSHPVKLNVPNRLIYSGHIYSWDSQFDQTDFSAYEYAVQQYQTYVTTPGQAFTAPFWLGEFGTNSADTWWNLTIELLQKHTNIGWAYWAVDGYKHSGGKGDDETFGIFEMDYKTIRHPWKLRDLQTVQASGETTRTITV